MILCANCGKPIEPCDCGGSACEGWGHLPPNGRHWCGRTTAGGKPTPLASPTMDA